ncbi:hypothetical protein ANN_11297, partial [Periplaneta americana]
MVKLTRVIEVRFPTTVINRHFTTMWPPRSPDFNPADFWLWSYLKERVFLTHSTTLLQLKDAISQEIVNIPRHYLQNAVHGIADNAVPYEDLEQAARLIVQALHVRERYMAISHQSFPSITSRFLRSVDSGCPHLLDDIQHEDRKTIE